MPSQALKRRSRCCTLHAMLDGHSQPLPTTQEAWLHTSNCQLSAQNPPVDQDLCSAWARPACVSVHVQPQAPAGTLQVSMPGCRSSAERSNYGLHAAKACACNQALSSNSANDTTETARLEHLPLRIALWPASLADTAHRVNYRKSSHSSMCRWSWPTQWPLAGSQSQHPPAAQWPPLASTCSSSWQQGCPARPSTSAWAGQRQLSAL